MDVFEAVKKRHSYRGVFTDTAVSREDLTAIVQAGLDAPSGKNAQTTEFVIIDDMALVDQLRQLHPGNQAMQTASAYIACVVDVAPEAIYESYSFQVEDCAAAVENMLLALTALGYSSVWIDGWLRLGGHAEMIGQMLNLPNGKVVRILLPVGKAATEYNHPAKKPFDQRVWFNRY